MAYVYKHIRKDTNEIFYIGIAKAKYRMTSTKSGNELWKRIVKKVGYIAEIIQDNLSWEDACKLEKELILQYGRRDNGTGVLVNMTDGGEGLSNITSDIVQKIVSSRKWYKHSEETKQKLKEVHIGRVFTDEHKRKLSESAKKRPSNRKGVVLSEETKLKISLSKKAKNNLEKS